MSVQSAIELPIDLALFNNMGRLKDKWRSSLDTLGAVDGARNRLQGLPLTVVR